MYIQKVAHLYLYVLLKCVIYRIHFLKIWNYSVNDISAFPRRWGLGCTMYKLIHLYILTLVPRKWHIETTEQRDDWKKFHFFVVVIVKQKLQEAKPFPALLWQLAALKNKKVAVFPDA